MTKYKIGNTTIIGSNNYIGRPILKYKPEEGLESLSCYLSLCKNKKGKKQYRKFKIFSKNGLVCHSCGCEATACFVQIDNEGTECYNFYSRRKDGTYVQFTVDHQLAVCNGGTDCEDNLVPMCILCNAIKSKEDRDNEFTNEYYNKAINLM